MHKKEESHKKAHKEMKNPKSHGMVALKAKIASKEGHSKRSK